MNAIFNFYFTFFNHKRYSRYNVNEAGDRLALATHLKGMAVQRPDLLKAFRRKVVEPGFGGQGFIESMIPKIHQSRELIDSYESKSNSSTRKIDLEVDGGINIDTATKVVDAGANIIVAGSAVYNKTKPIKQSISDLRNSLIR